MMPDPASSALRHPTSSASERDLSRRTFVSELARYAGVLMAAPFVANRLQAQPSTNADDGAVATSVANAAPIAVMVYKDASCGCCKEWVKHMQKAGFAVTAKDMPDMAAMKKKLGVPDSMGSCHTAVIGDYLVEGHVPADVVQIMLKEKPVARGLAVPGMPMGSPGMEGPTKQKYDVMLFEKSGKARVYASR